MAPLADRTTHVTVTAGAFIARLASLVPRPCKNTIVYFGVLAAHAKGRADIVPCPEPERRTRPDSSWAALMKHSFGLDVLALRRLAAARRGAPRQRRGAPFTRAPHALGGGIEHAGGGGGGTGGEGGRCRRCATASSSLTRSSSFASCVVSSAFVARICAS